MLSENIRIGYLGEHAAAVYLRKNGYTILSGNFKSKTGEIDIVAEKDSTVCFEEIKTRKEGTMFPPSEAVDKKKQENIKNTAAFYMLSSKLELDMRFDIIEVVVKDNDECSITHLINAF